MNDIKIAYICICHKDPAFIARLAASLEYNRGDDKFFVHVDKKVDEQPFLEACKNQKNVVFVTDRVKNYWGGFNSIIATMNTIKLAMNTDRYDRFVLLQGQDYPLTSPKQIHEFFIKNYDVEYCKAINISVSHHKGDYMKCCGMWFQDGDHIKILRSAFGRINRLGIKYRPAKFYDNKQKEYCIYHGWAQFALTYQCMKHVLNFYQNNKDYNSYMKHRFPPDELYIHTIIYNSEYKEKVAKEAIVLRDGKKTLLNLTYFEYPVYVTEFKDAEDFEWLKKTNCLFVRKVNSESGKLLDVIDEFIKEH